MRRIAQALCGAVALLFTVTGLAHADVAPINTPSAGPVSASIAGPRTVPSSGEVELALGASDPGGVAVTGTLDWGDGHIEPFAGAGTVRHTYAAPGDYTVAYVLRDGAEEATARHTLSVALLQAPHVKPEPAPATPSAGGVAGLTTTQPVRISDLAVTPRCIRCATIDVSFRVNASAPVRLTLERSKHKSGAAACPPVRGHAKAGGKRISKPAVDAHAGVNTVSLEATDGNGRKLRPGTYLLTIRSGTASAIVGVRVRS